jgi:hypothetical protein
MSSYIFLGQKLDPGLAGPFLSLPNIPPVSSMQLMELAFQPLNIGPTFHSLDHHNNILSQSTLPSNHAFQHDGLYIPALQHPNSPYVPWNSDLCRNILRPISTASQSPSLNIAKMNSSPETRGALKLLRSTMKNSFLRFYNRWKGAPSGQPRQPKPVPLNPSPPAVTLEVPPSPSTSICSSSTLTAWLATKRQQAEESVCHPAKLLTLEEYERRGSWLDFHARHYPSSHSISFDSDCTSTRESSIMRLLSPGNSASTIQYTTVNNLTTFIARKLD